MKTSWIFSKKMLYTLSAVIVMYSLAGFFLLPVVGKNIIKNKLSTFLNREVTIEKISVNPFALTAEIDALNIKKKKIFFSAERIFLNLSIASLFTFTPVASEFLVEKPYLNIIRNKDKSFNFSDLLLSKKTAATDNNHEKENQTSGKPGAFILKNISIRQGRIEFMDKSCNVSHLVKNLSLSIPFLSSKTKYRHQKSNLNMNFILNKAKFNIHAESAPFAKDMAALADIKTEDIDVIHYLSYLPVPENIHIKSLGINLNLHADFHRDQSKNSLLLQGTVNALNTDIRGIDQKKIMKLPVLSLHISPSDILAGQLNIATLLMKSPEINLARDEKGKLSLLPYISRNKEKSHPENDNPSS